MASILNNIDLQNIGYVPVGTTGGANPCGDGVTLYQHMNQLAVRPRTVDFEKALQAKIHDPMFMLTRQWQFGEFQFEDTGSAIFAKIAMEYTKLSRIKAQNTGATAQAFDNSIPLETVVERQRVKLSLQECIRIGEQWLYILNETLVNDIANFDNNNTDDVDFKLYMDAFLSGYTFDSITSHTYDTDGNLLGEDSTLFSEAKELSKSKELQYRRLIIGRKVDGQKILDQVNPLGVINLNGFDDLVDVAHNSAVQNAIQRFVDWYNELYSTPSQDNSDSCWNEKSLAYDVEVSMPQHGVSTNKVLKVKDYGSKDLEWFAFDEKPSGDSDTDMEEAAADSSIPNLDETGLTQTKLISLLPSQSGFAGMPASRWWEFEDGEMNFGTSNMSTTDISKILLTEFALVYQDDWFSVPYNVEIGSYAEVKGILVKDVFGQQTFVQHTTSHISGSNWDEWNLHNLSEYDDEPGVSPAGQALFFPPTLSHKMESEPLEEVLFFRDEIANMVWALEKKVLGHRGKGIDANLAVSELKEYLLNLKPEEGVDTTTAADLKYRLMSEVPMNWIPFIPVRDTSATDNRSIKLQRAAMPLSLPNYDGTVAIRPQTGYLRKGISDSDDLELTDPTYFIDEELVTRAGLTIKKKNQRARWLDGKTYLWQGTTKTLGRGEGASHLRFDEVLNTNKDETSDYDVEAQAFSSDFSTEFL